jgi:hypothetical protein
LFLATTGMVALGLMEIETITEERIKITHRPSRGDRAGDVIFLEW